MKAKTTGLIMHYSALGDLLRVDGYRCELLTKQAKWTLQQNWRQCYARRLREQAGHWSSRDGVDWGVFVTGLAACVKGAEADSLYAELSAGNFAVISSHPEIASYLCEMQYPPRLERLIEFVEESPYHLDLFVLAVDLTWTLVVTHEGGCDRYFARQEWQGDYGPSWKDEA